MEINRFSFVVLAPVSSKYKSGSPCDSDFYVIAEIVSVKAKSIKIEIFKPSE